MVFYTSECRSRSSSATLLTIVVPSGESDQLPPEFDDFDVMMMSLCHCYVMIVMVILSVTRHVHLPKNLPISSGVQVSDYCPPRA